MKILQIYQIKKNKNDYIICNNDPNQILYSSNNVISEGLGYANPELNNNSNQYYNIFNLHATDIEIPSAEQLFEFMNEKIVNKFSNIFDVDKDLSVYNLNDPIELNIFNTYKTQYGKFISIEFNTCYKDIFYSKICILGYGKTDDTMYYIDFNDGIGYFKNMSINSIDDTILMIDILQQDIETNLSDVYAALLACNVYKNIFTKELPEIYVIIGKLNYIYFLIRNNNPIKRYEKVLVKKMKHNVLIIRGKNIYNRITDRVNGIIDLNKFVVVNNINIYNKNLVERLHNTSYIHTVSIDNNLSTITLWSVVGFVYCMTYNKRMFDRIDNKVLNSIKNYESEINNIAKSSLSSKTKCELLKSKNWRAKIWPWIKEK